MTSAQQRALVIAHEPDGMSSQIGVRLAERGFVLDTHIVTVDYDQPNEASAFPELDGYDLLVLMGSVRSLTNTAEIDTWIYTELDLIRDAHASGLPILGICFGGQLISEALGGSVERSPEPEIGWYTIDDGDQPNPVGPGPWLQWHFDRFTPPPEAVVLARNAAAEQLFAVGTTVGTQFHPEIDVPHMQGWLETTDDDYLASIGTSRVELTESTAAHQDAAIERCHRLVDWYLDEVTSLGDSPTTEDGIR